MSIILQVKDYCQKCPNFEADVDSKVIRHNDDSIYSCTHLITCVHWDKCEAIETYLKGSNR